jgi:sulfur-oxidizing protein SoxY
MTEVGANRSGWLTSSGLQMVSRRTFLRLASTLLTVWCAKLEAGRQAYALTSELQHPADPSHPTSFEQLHLPILKVPSVTRNGAHVPVVVELRHPMEPDHYIRSIQILNEGDPIPSKGIFHLSPTNGQAYLSVQARMHSGTSAVLVIAECTLHGRWAMSQPITIPEGGGGCANTTEGGDDLSVDDAIGPPVIRIPELVERGKITRGETIRVQMKVKHPNRTGLTLQGATFLQAADPFYLKEMKVFYGDRLVSRYEMTPAISNNPFITFTLRASEQSPIRIVLTNSRGQQFQAAQEVVFG